MLNMPRFFRRHSRIRNLTGAILLFSFLLVSLYALRGSIQSVFSPLLSTGNSMAALVPGYDFFKSRSALIRENENLRTEIEALRNVTIAYRALEAEYQSFLEVLGREAGENQGVIAQVLTRPPLSLYDTLLIDAGEGEGIMVGDIVMVGAVAIGDVRSVYAHTSLVVFFSSPGRETEVLIGDQNIRAIAIGKGGGMFEVRLPRGVIVEEGMNVLMPRLNPAVFGVVGKITTTPADSFQTVLFRNPMNMSMLSKVLVLEGYAAE